MGWRVTWFGLGWLRAVAQGYNYSCSKIEFVSNFQRNLKSWEVECSWGLDGCARWRNVVITVTLTVSCGVVFKIIQ